jgi:arginine decarboxylase
MSEPVAIKALRSGKRLSDLLAQTRLLLSDPANAAELQLLPTTEPDAVARIAQEFFAILSILDNSGSNPALEGLQARGGGPIGSLNEHIRSVYGAREAQFVESGSSGGNIRLGLALKRALARSRTSLVAIDRFAHASVIGAAAIADLDVHFMHRSYRQDLDVTLPLAAEEIDTVLGATGAAAVWITAPTYDGFVGDLRRIEEVCRQHEAYLLVDAAWGVLHGLRGFEAFPNSAIKAGADAAVVSLHKKGAGLSQASAAQFNDLKLARYFRLAGDIGLATTSPLYFLPGSAQVGLDVLQTEAGQVAWQQAIEAANAFRELIDGYRGCRIIRAADLGPGVVGDPCHVLVNVSQTGINGYRILRALNGEMKDIEMATRDTVMLLFGPEHHGVASAIADAFRGAIDVLEREPPRHKLLVPPLNVPRAMTLHEALVAESQPMLLADAVGRVAAQMIGAYPPGQAIVCLGEFITPEVANYLHAVEAAGGRIKGVGGPLATTMIEVVSV